MADTAATLRRLAAASKSGWTEIQVLPCGCVIGQELQEDGTRAFGYVPHDLNCKYFLYAQDQGVQQGKDFEIRMAE